GTAAFFGAWLASLLIFAPHPSSLPAADPFRITPLIPFFFAASSATVLAALWRSSSLRRALAAVPLAALNAVHTWRLLGMVFVLLYTEGQLPAHFALPAGWGDVAIGVTAPLVAFALARGVRGATTMAVSWNVLGLLDLAVAVGMGTGLLAPLLPLDLGPRVPPAAAMGVLPMILVPGFAVPLAVLMHLLALRGLLRWTRLSPGTLAVETR
ncbi:MAG TPA: hypothetical protein VFT13_00385, partial [Candidatus Krumholzibacteria bacterium]|nr:hypothetical protein [Candidatus Krumholzibacteria bacterium]